MNTGDLKSATASWFGRYTFLWWQYESSWTTKNGEATRRMHPHPRSWLPEFLILAERMLKSPSGTCDNESDEEKSHLALYTPVAWTHLLIEFPVWSWLCHCNHTSWLPDYCGSYNWLLIHYHNIIIIIIYILFSFTTLPNLSTFLLLFSDVNILVKINVIFINVTFALQLQHTAANFTLFNISLTLANRCCNSSFRNERTVSIRRGTMCMCGNVSKYTPLQFAVQNVRRQPEIKILWNPTYLAAEETENSEV